jgi:LysM repeat protein
MLCAVAIAAGAGGCFGGSDGGTEGPDSSKIATATLPAELPEPRIINQSVVQADGGSSYIVRSGDTLAGIAERFGISLEDLVAANPGVNASSLSVGQTIRLPDDVDVQAPPPPTATPAEAPTEAPTEPPSAETPVLAVTVTPTAPTPEPPAGGQTYVVQAGDIPVTIAERFGVTVEALLAANPGLDPTGLDIEQVINIPPPATP